MKKVFKGVMLVFFAAFLVVLGGCSKSNAEDRANDDIKWQFISPADMKKVVQTEDTSNYQILDIQPKKDFAKGHIPGSISVPAYPVDTKELEKLVVDAAPKWCQTFDFTFDRRRHREITFVHCGKWREKMAV